MKKKILILMPSIWAGGTNSSLINLLANVDSAKYDVDVFVICQSGYRRLPYENQMLPKNHLLSAYYGDLTKTSGCEKVTTILVKTLKKISRHLGVDVSKLIINRAIKRINTDSYDCIVSYLEGYTTLFGSLIEHPNKIAWIHCDYNRYKGNRGGELSIYSSFRKIVTVSKYTTQVFAEFYPALINKLETIYNLLDVEGIKSKANEPIDDIRFKSDLFTLVSVGRVTPVKRFPSIPKIASDLKAKGLKFRWFIIGPVLSVAEKNMIEDGIKMYNVEDCCIYLGGKSNPYPYFKAADLYVCTSLSEACPMVFIEARILNTPIVSTNFPASFEFIEDGVNGYVSSLENIGERISQLISNKEDYSKILENSDKFSYDNAIELDKIYKTLNV